MSPNMICMFRKGKSYIKTETHREKMREVGTAVMPLHPEPRNTQDPLWPPEGRKRQGKTTQSLRACMIPLRLMWTVSLQICEGINFSPFKLCSGQYFITAPLGNQYKDQICFLAFFSLWQPPAFLGWWLFSFISKPSTGKSSPSHAKLWALLPLPHLLLRLLLFSPLPLLKVLGITHNTPR